MVSAVYTNAVSMGVQLLFVFEAFQANDAMPYLPIGNFIKKIFSNKEKT